MDAIVDFDAEFQVALMNPAARRCLRRDERDEPRVERKDTRRDPFWRGAERPEASAVNDGFKRHARGIGRVIEAVVQSGGRRLRPKGGILMAQQSVQDAGIGARVVPIGASDFAMTSSDSFTVLLDQAVSGGPGTTNYLSHLQAFAQLTRHIQQAGEAAFSSVPSPDGSRLALVASDGKSTLRFETALSPGLAPITVGGVQVTGLATITLETPGPSNLTKVAEFGWDIFDKAHEVHTAAELWKPLIKPLMQQGRRLMSELVERWLSTDAQNAGAITRDLAADTDAVVSDVSSETTTVLEETGEAVEMAIEWGEVAATMGWFALVAAVPIVVEALEKNFVLNLQLNNVCRSKDFSWELAYFAQGAASSQPAVSTLPMPSTSQNPLTSVKRTVIHQADFTFVNTDGFEGLGFVLLLTPAGAKQPLVAAIIGIPWAGNNVVHLVSAVDAYGHPIAGSDLYATFAAQPSDVTAQWGDAKYFFEIGIDSLEGHDDQYNCVLRIRDL